MEARRPSHVLGEAKFVCELEEKAATDVGRKLRIQSKVSSIYNTAVKIPTEDQLRELGVVI